MDEPSIIGNIIYNFPYKYAGWAAFTGAISAGPITFLVKHYLHKNSTTDHVTTGGIVFAFFLALSLGSVFLFQIYNVVEDLRKSLSGEPAAAAPVSPQRRSDGLSMAPQGS